MIVAGVQVQAILYENLQSMGSVKEKTMAGDRKDSPFHVSWKERCVLLLLSTRKRENHKSIIHTEGKQIKTMNFSIVVKIG